RFRASFTSAVPTALQRLPALRSKCPEIGESRQYAKGGANRVQPAPGPYQGTRGRARHVGWGCLEPGVGRHDGEQGEGPIGEDESGANDPAPVACLPGGDQAERPGTGRKARLHGRAARITRLELREKVLVVEPQAGWLLGNADEQGGAGKGGRRHEGEMAGEH